MRGRHVLQFDLGDVLVNEHEPLLRQLHAVGEAQAADEDVARGELVWQMPWPDNRPATAWPQAQHASLLRHDNDLP